MKVHRDKLNETQAKVSAIEKDFRDRLDRRDPSFDQPDMDELEYRFYRDTWQKLPDFDTLKAETVAKLERGFFDISPATREFSFGFVFTGTLKVPADGEYTFVVDSDDGSRLSVNGQAIILYDGIHGTGTPHLAKMTLKQEGRVPIRMDYFQGPAGEGTDRQVVRSWIRATISLGNDRRRIAVGRSARKAQGFRRANCVAGSLDFRKSAA